MVREEFVRQKGSRRMGLHFGGVWAWMVVVLVWNAFWTSSFEIELYRNGGEHVQLGVYAMTVAI